MTQTVSTIISQLKSLATTMRGAENRQIGDLTARTLELAQVVEDLMAEVRAHRERLDRVDL